jgi:hypothetical protein
MDRQANVTARFPINAPAKIVRHELSRRLGGTASKQMLMSEPVTQQEAAG